MTTKTKYLNERNLIIELTKDQFDRLPDNVQARLVPYKEPSIPEFLKLKKENESISKSAEPQDGARTSGDTGGSGIPAKEKVGEDIGEPKATISKRPGATKGKPGRKPASAAGKPAAKKAGRPAKR